MHSFNLARAQLIKDLRQGSANLNRETKISTDQLIQINRLGMLTLDSQQGRIEYGQVPTDRELQARLWKKLNSRFWKTGGNYQELLKKLDQQYEKLGGTYKRGIVSKEKAYLTGIVPVKKADRLIHYLNQIDGLVAWQVGADAIGGSKTWVTYVPTTQDGAYSSSDRYPLIGVTHVNTFAFPFSSSEYGEKVKADPSQDQLFATITIQDARFGHLASAKDGLFNQVIKVLENK